MVVLRVSVLASFVAVALGHPNVRAYPGVPAAVALASLCLAIGFATPVMSAVAGAVAVADMVFGGPSPGFSLQYVLILDAAALALLGPGAYSADARLFGRRVTVLPTNTGDD